MSINKNILKGFTKLNEANLSSQESYVATKFIKWYNDENGSEVSLDDLEIRNLELRGDDTGIEIGVEGEEYLAFSGYDGAQERARDNFGEAFEELGIGLLNWDNMGGLEAYLSETAMNWFYEWKKEDAEMYFNDLDEEDQKTELVEAGVIESEEEYDEDYGDYEIDYVEAKIGGMTEQDCMQEYVDMVGEEAFNETISNNVENGWLDVDELFDFIENSDGLGINLATYDSDEIEFEDIFIYRTN